LGITKGEYYMNRIIIMMIMNTTNNQIGIKLMLKMLGKCPKGSILIF